jgi:ribosomal protein S18 acetylase RimI-like enzyme
MSEIVIRRLGESEWREFREVRLAALRESPDAFAATADEEQLYDDSVWADRVSRSVRIVAEADGVPAGVVCVGHHAPDDDLAEPGETGEIFGLWVSPDLRGTGVATRLIEAGAAQARADGSRRLAYWVSTDNGRAVAFASGMGFRPTDYRRPMRGSGGRVVEGGDEVAMVLALGEDRSPR